MRRRRRWLMAAVACVLSLGGCAAPTDFGRRADVEWSGEVVTPLARAPLPIITLTMDGTRARVLVDSGAETTVVDPDFARRAGLDVRGIARDFDVVVPGEERLAVREWADIREVRIGSGDATARAFDVAAPLVEFSQAPFEIDAVLGNDVLVNWTVMFDRPRRRLRIAPPGDVDGWAAAREFAFLRLPLRYVDERPLVTVAVPECELVLDTGAHGLVLPTSVAASLGRGRDQDSWTLAGPRSTPIVQLPELRVTDRIRWRDVEASVIEGDVGLLGYGLLSARPFVVDGPGSSLWLPVGDETAP